MDLPGYDDWKTSQPIEWDEAIERDERAAAAHEEAEYMAWVEGMARERHECDCGAVWFNYNPRIERCPTCHAEEQR